MGKRGRPRKFPEHIQSIVEPVVKYKVDVNDEVPVSEPKNDTVVSKKPHDYHNEVIFMYGLICGLSLCLAVAIMARL